MNSFDNTCVPGPQRPSINTNAGVSADAPAKSGASPANLTHLSTAQYVMPTKSSTKLHKSNKSLSRTNAPTLENDVFVGAKNHKINNPMLQKALERKEKDKRRQKRAKDAREFSKQKGKDISSFIKQAETVRRKRAEFIRYRQRIDQIQYKISKNKIVTDESASQEAMDWMGSIELEEEDRRERLATFTSLDRHLQQDFDYNPVPPSHRKNYPSFVSSVSRGSPRRSQLPKSGRGTFDDSHDGNDGNLMNNPTGVIRIPGINATRQMGDAGDVSVREMVMDTFSPHPADNPRYTFSTFPSHSAYSNSVEDSGAGIVDATGGNDGGPTARNNALITKDLELDSATLELSVGKESMDIVGTNHELAQKSRQAAPIASNIDMQKLLNELDHFISNGKPSSSAFLMRTETDDR